MLSDDGKPRDYCGIFGVYGLEDAANLVVLGLHALQHRGQEGAGIVSYDGQDFFSRRVAGLVSEGLHQQETLEALPGNHAIGHVRYSTSGEKNNVNISPVFAELNTGGCAIAHNGNLTNALSLRKQLISQGSIFQSKIDTEVIIHLLAHSQKSTFVERFSDAVTQIEGGFALVALTRKKLIGLRDPLGIRPLVLGSLDGKPVLSSETCALDIIGATYVRDIAAGEMVVFSDKGERSYFPFGPCRERLCAFEYIYFSRPDSVIGGQSVYNVRTRFGEVLAEESPADIDMVVPVPDSGVPAAIGYARAMNKPYELGIIRNHYVGRTFIQPSQTIRAFGVRLKHNVNRELVQGKRVVLIDDSLVRGTTAFKIIAMMREAGATEVHLRVSAPPIRHSDYYGIDTPSPNELIASMMSLSDLEKRLNVDSLAFLSVEGLYRAIGYHERNRQNPQLTDHYFTGEYPTRLRDIEEGLLC